MRSFITNALVMGMVCGGIMAALGSRLAAAAGDDQSASLYIVNVDKAGQHKNIQGDPGEIDVMDFVTRKIVRTIKVVPGPHGVKFSPDGRRMYVGSEDKPVLGVVDLVTGEMIKTVPLSSVAHGDLALTKDGKRLFVPTGVFHSNMPGALDIIDTTTLERVKSIPMKNDLHDIYLTPDEKYLICGTEDGGVLIVVDVQAGQQAWDINFAEPAVMTMAIEAGPDGSTSRLFVMRGGLHGFTVVDFAKRKVVAEIVLPETDKFKGNTNDHEVRSHGIEIAPDKKTLWANSRGGDAVFEYSLPDLKLVGRVNVGRSPSWIAISPDSKKVYVNNSGEQSVSVIDAKSLEVMRMQLRARVRKMFPGPVYRPAVALP